MRLLPALVPYASIAGDADPANPLDLPIGIAETDLHPARVDFGAEPHLLVFGDAGAGKSALLRGLAKTISDRFAPEEARIVLVDHRRSLLGAVRTEHLIGYGTGAQQTEDLIASVAAYMQRRLPGPDVTQEQLRNRGWWTGPECFVLVDDYDLVATGPGNPLDPLLPYLAQARDVGLHLVVGPAQRRRVTGPVRAGAAAAAGAVLAGPAAVRGPGGGRAARQRPPRSAATGAGLAGHPPRRRAPDPGRARRGGLKRLFDRTGGRGDARVVIGAVRDRVLVALPGGDDLGLGLDPADPGRALDALARLQVLVDLEEVLDLQPVELAQVVDVAQVLQARVLRGHAEHLVVAALFVRHPEHADRPGADQAARKRRALHQHERVERVLVLAERALDEAIIGRVLRRGEQRPVEPDPARRMVNLVLVALTFRDFDRYVEVHLMTPHPRTAAPTISLPDSTTAENGEGPLARERPQVGTVVAAIALVVALVAALGSVYAGPQTIRLLGLAGSGEQAKWTAGVTPELPPAVLAAMDSQAPLPSPDGVKAALASLLAAPALGPHITASVVDVATGQVLFASEPDAAMTPASTTKVVTAVAALAARGPAYRIPTRVVAGAQPGEVVIVAGGDPTLAVFPTPYYPGAARLDDLAAQVKKALGDTAPTKVIYDNSVFTGSGIGPGWDADATTAGSGAVITPLMTEGGRYRGQRQVRRSVSAARRPGRAGVREDARAAGRPAAGAGTGPAGGVRPGELGKVESPPMVRLVEFMLQESDNVLAEALARQVALARGQPASFEGGAAAMRVVCRAGPARDRDRRSSTAAGSPATNRLVPGAADRRCWRWPPARTGPTCTRIFSGLPVAGWSGTLRDAVRASRRRPPRCGRAGPGQDRHADRGASRSPGVVTTADGRPLAFAFMADRCRRRDKARVALDRIAAALAACGCRQLTRRLRVASGSSRRAGRWSGAGTVGSWRSSSTGIWPRPPPRRWASRGPRVSYDEATDVVTDLRRLTDEAAEHVARYTGLRPQVAHPPVRVVDRRDWAATNIAGLREVITRWSSRLAGGQAAGRGRRRDRLTADRRPGRHGAGLPVRQGPRAVRGLLRRTPASCCWSRRTSSRWSASSAPSRATSGSGCACTRSPTGSSSPRSPGCGGISSARSGVRGRVQLGEHLAERLAGASAPSPTWSATPTARFSVFDLVQTPGQRAVLDRLTALMTLLEGHAEFVMDGVGPEVIPSVEECGPVQPAPRGRQPARAGAAQAARRRREDAPVRRGPQVRARGRGAGRHGRLKPDLRVAADHSAAGRARRPRRVGRAGARRERAEPAVAVPPVTRAAAAATSLRRRRPRPRPASSRYTGARADTT